MGKKTEWSLNIDEWAKGSIKKVEAVKNAFAFAAYASVVKTTPVGHPDFDPASGRARGNWNISVGKPDLTVTDKREPRHNLSNMPKAKGDETIYISNNLPYIKTLEYGGYPPEPKRGSHTRKGIKPPRWEIFSKGGFSKQAPNGMIAVTVANKENLLKAAMRAADRIEE